MGYLIELVDLNKPVKPNHVLSTTKFTMTDPIVDQKLLLQKSPGKGGWTYAEVPELDKVSRPNFWMGESNGHR